jgi:outer membrane biosynthesis protein TonB
MKRTRCACPAPGALAAVMVAAALLLPGTLVTAITAAAAGPATASVQAATMPGRVATTTGAKSCSPRLQAYFASDFKDAEYQKRAFQKIAAAWKRPKESPAAGAKTVVITSIEAGGAASAPVLHMKSGSDGWDAAALAAVKAAAPFDPLPKSYAHPSVEVHFHFECAAPDVPRMGS